MYVSNFQWLIGMSDERFILKQNRQYVDVKMTEKYESNEL